LREELQKQNLCEVLKMCDLNRSIPGHIHMRHLPNAAARAYEMKEVPGS